MTTSINTGKAEIPSLEKMVARIWPKGYTAHGAHSRLIILIALVEALESVSPEVLQKHGIDIDDTVPLLMKKLNEVLGNSIGCKDPKKVDDNDPRLTALSVAVTCRSRSTTHHVLDAYTDSKLAGILRNLGNELCSRQNLLGWRLRAFEQFLYRADATAPDPALLDTDHASTLGSIDLRSSHTRLESLVVLGDYLRTSLVDKSRDDKLSLLAALMKELDHDQLGSLYASNFIIHDLEGMSNIYLRDDVHSLTYF